MKAPTLPKNMQRAVLLLLLVMLLSVVFSIPVLGQGEGEVPIGLQRILEYNQKASADFAVKVSFFIAFIAGMLGILSPCILPFLPAYFAYTFKERKNITKMTFIFFLGFTAVFVTMGVIAGFLGSQSLLVLQKAWLMILAGAFLVIFGLMTLFGKGFGSFIKTSRKFSNDIPGTFLFGIFFAIGWTACLGPILAGILGLGAILGSAVASGLLLFFYSLGNLVPLFILSVFYDKLNLAESKFMRGREITFSLGSKKFHVHSTNLISGLLLLFIGIIIIIYKGTSVFNTWDFFDTKQYFYSIQDKLIGWQYANILGMVLFLLFVGLLYYGWHKRNHGGNENE